MTASYKNRLERAQTNLNPWLSENHILPANVAIYGSCMSWKMETEGMGSFSVIFPLNGEYTGWYYFFGSGKDAVHKTGSEDVLEDVPEYFQNLYHRFQEKIREHHAFCLQQEEEFREKAPPIFSIPPTPSPFKEERSEEVGSLG